LLQLTAIICKHLEKSIYAATAAPATTFPPASADFFSFFFFLGVFGFLVLFLH